MYYLIPHISSPTSHLISSLTPHLLPHTSSPPSHLITSLSSLNTQFQISFLIPYISCLIPQPFIPHLISLIPSPSSHVLHPLSKSLFSHPSFLKPHLLPPILPHPALYSFIPPTHLILALTPHILPHTLDLFTHYSSLTTHLSSLLLHP